MQGSILGILSSSDQYKEFDDSTKAIISKIVNGIDSDFVASFASQDNAEIALRKWINGNLIDPFTELDLTNIIDTKSLFDTGKISVSDYEKIYSGFLTSISNFAPEVQQSLMDAFSPDVDNLIANVEKKLSDTSMPGVEYQVKSLTLDQLKIASELEVPDDALLSWAELKRSHYRYSNSGSNESIDTIASSLETLTTQSTALNSAINEQNKNGYVSYETYQSLIEAVPLRRCARHNLNGQKYRHNGNLLQSD